jgi:Holliday junction resolvase
MRRASPWQREPPVATEVRMPAVRYQAVDEIDIVAAPPRRRRILLGSVVNLVRMENQKDVMPLDGTRLIQDVLAELGWAADAVAVANGVRRLDIGLLAEDEFSVVCTWLGKCLLLHKLDQLQVPIASRREFQVPDLLARFSTQTNKSPVLIEVKAKKEKLLSFKPDYLERLQNYADLVDMPLLIAWKFYRLWMLFEAKHMKKARQNFNVSLETASRENLLGVLAGDVAYKIGVGAGVHIRFRKDRLLETKQTNDGHTEEWMMVVDDVAFTDYKGNRRTDLDSEVQSLFSTWDLDDQEEHTDSHIQLRFVAGEEGIEFAHGALVRLLNWEAPHSDQPQWRHLLRKEQVTANVANLSAALSTALQQKVVSHIFHVEPHSMPDFLPHRQSSTQP